MERLFLSGGSIWNGTKDKLPDFAFFAVGTDIGLTRRLTAAIDYIGQELSVRRA